MHITEFEVCYNKEILKTMNNKNLKKKKILYTFIEINRKNMCLNNE